MRISGYVFASFTLLMMILMGSCLLFHPNGRQPIYISQVLVIFGAILGWSFYATNQLLSNQKFGSAIGLVVLLTFFVVMGVAQNGGLKLTGVVHPILRHIRAICGVHIILMWLSLAWDCLVGRKERGLIQSPTTSTETPPRER